MSDGWTDLAGNYEMDWAFDRAPDGNIALTGEIDLRQDTEFALVLAFGDACQSAVTALLQCLGFPFAPHRDRFVDQWERGCKHTLLLAKVAGDGVTGLLAADNTDTPLRALV